jgi:hypothetical protein
MTQFGSITARVLNEGEIETLTPEDLVYVPAPEFYGPVLTPGHLKGGDDYYRERQSFCVKTIYGTESHYKPDSIYVADDNGEEYAAIRTCGVKISSTLFFPDITEEEAQERLFKALRAEFGPGVVELWNKRSGPVRDVTWDVHGITRDVVKAAKGKEPAVVETEQRTIARGVRDGHAWFFRNHAQRGEQIVCDVQLPEQSSTFTI